MNPPSGKLGLILILALGLLLSACSAPPSVISGDGIVHAVLFWTPGCSSCEKVLKDVLPPLEARYGGRLQMLEVPLNDLSEVDRLYASAGFFKINKGDILVPFVVIGSDVLSGETAVESHLDEKIKAGIVAGGLVQPALPPQLAELAARPTSTPRATLPPFIEVPGAGVQSDACSLNNPCVMTATPTP
jgi:hypothetical protein